MMSNRLPQREKQAGRVCVGAFGKHPGWDDHIENLGLDTQPLIALKRTLYIEGVGGNLDAGAWDQLEDRQKIDGFHHVIVSMTRDAVVMGRMWASLDGKGRARYPMVVCAHGTGIPLPWLLATVSPHLEEVETRCRAAKSASEVRAVLDETRAALCAAMPVDEDEGCRVRMGPDQTVFELLREAGLAENREGLMRFLYQVERDVSTHPVVPGEGKAGTQQPQHIRVPACGDDVVRSCLLWVAVMRSLLHGGVPLILLRPLDHPWVDIVVGDAKAQQLYCLLASLEAIPLVTDVPYKMDEDFLERAEQWISSWEAEELDVEQLLLDVGRGRESAAGWKQWFDQMKELFGKG